AARGETVKRCAGSREATRRRRELGVWRREVEGWRRGTSSTVTATATRSSSAVSATFSPIPPAPIRIGEGEAPPSWDPVTTPKAMVGKGSPRFNMSNSPKVLRYVPTTSGTKKRPSPKCSGAKKTGGSPRVVKKRADWNPGLEKSLVDILLEYKESGYRGDNGWNSEGWNRMVKEFHVRNKYVSFTKTQIQDKEGQLKKDYKMLKAAKEQSGSTWNEKRCMVEGSPALWENLMVTFPKIKKFNNSKASFPLFDALGELYDGHLAQGTYNITSLEEESPEQLHDAVNEPPFVGEEDPLEEDPHVLQLPVDAPTQRDEEMLQERTNILSRDEESEEVPIVQGSGQRRPTTSRNKHEKEPKRTRRNEEIVGIMGAYLEMRTKQAEVEAADRAREMEEREREAREREDKEREDREREARQASDFSIKRCFSILNTLDVMKEEKAKGYAILIKSKENREAFVCACELDEESALIWLRSEMA
ncbi:unnamed protein product, partial [Urochloa humidicola]